jgi:hypothetical protein
VRHQMRHSMRRCVRMDEIVNEAKVIRK